jgi:hypothetical protein
LRAVEIDLCDESHKIDMMQLGEQWKMTGRNYRAMNTTAY